MPAAWVSLDDSDNDSARFLAYVIAALQQIDSSQIKVPGHLDESWSDWAGGMTITLEGGDDDPSTTTLTGVVADQAALQGLLRRFYSLGLPLISVNWVNAEK